MLIKSTAVIIALLASFISGAMLGYDEGQETSIKSQLDNIQRFERTNDVAYAFVSLRAIMDKDNSGAIYNLNNQIIASIRQLTELYSPGNVESANEIISLIEMITEWRKNNNFDYGNARELDRALEEFNIKHNKSFKRDGEPVACFQIQYSAAA